MQDYDTPGVFEVEINTATRERKAQKTDKKNKEAKMEVWRDRNAGDAKLSLGSLR